MATRKNTTPKKESKELIVLVPSKWGLTPEEVKKLQLALEPVANITFERMRGDICVVTGVTNGISSGSKKT